MKVFQLGSIDSNFQILSVLYKVDWTVLNYVACTRGPLMNSREPKVKFYLAIKGINRLIVN